MCCTQAREDGLRELGWMVESHTVAVGQIGAVSNKLNIGTTLPTPTTTNYRIIPFVVTNVNSYVILANGNYVISFVCLATTLAIM